MISHSQRALCSLLSIVGAFTLVFAADPALAATTGELRSVRVAYADLDLTRPAGRATFERRLAGAAAQVCTTDDAHGTTIDRACRDKAVTLARRDAGVAAPTAPQG